MTSIGLRRWLLAHPGAWQGWPTRIVFVSDEETRLLDQLRRHGLFCATTAILPNVTDAVRTIRAERRRRYVVQAQIAAY